MKISYLWLKEHLPLTIPADELAGHLLQLGFEVAEISRRGAPFSGVVAAEILSIAKHPNADRLSLCQVNDGSRTLSIVCGASNIAVGQKIPLAREGAVLPGGFKIGRSKIRGVESEGMICSSQELGLAPEGNGGIRVLDRATALGADMAQVLGPSDDILDVEITPNRPDCLSHLGLARELSAFLRRPLAKPAGAAALPAAAGDCLPVAVSAARACPRYLGRVFNHLRVGPSPGWLASRLESIGLRPVNNLVDVTNFILMDMGQPLHAFDADALEGGRIIVRFAAAAEKIKALDGRDYALTSECLVIADAKKPAAIAGVMGGEASAVSGKTTRAFLESAYFAPEAVRKASQTLRLRSDASQRFERGADVSAVAPAAEKAAALILALCGKQAQASAAAEFYPAPRRPERIVVSTERVNRILGSSFSESEVEAALGGIAPLAKDGPRLELAVPAHRHDLATPWDLAEEAARLIGYGKIPSRLPAVALAPTPDTPARAAAERCRLRLAALGFFEAYNYDFLSEKLLAQAKIAENGRDFARLANPLNEDWAILRPTLLIGLLQNAARNLNGGAASVRLFEIGKVYRREAAGIAENTRLSGLILGPRTEPHWENPRPARSDFFDAKGVIEELAAGVPRVLWTAPEPDALKGAAVLFHPKACLNLSGPDGVWATVGLLRPQAARAWELEKEGAVLFDLDLDLLAAAPPAPPHFEAPSAFPSSARDLSFFVAAPTPYAQVERAVLSCRVAELSRLDLIDVFSGKGVPEGKKSLTIRLSFGRRDRTLTDAEVNAAVDKILAGLKNGVGAVLRA